jgi:hypothetical protein
MDRDFPMFESASSTVSFIVQNAGKYQCQKYYGFPQIFFDIIRQCGAMRFGERLEIETILQMRKYVR